MTQARALQPDRRGGFTLIELLVVIVIITLLVGIAVPAVAPIVASSKSVGARRTISASADLARAYSTRPRADLGAAGGVPGATYSGAAAVFTQRSGDDVLGTARRIRIVENDQRAFNGGDPRFLEMQNNDPQGYRPIPDVDPLELPRDVDLVGLRANGDRVTLDDDTAFAVVFNEHGNLATPNEIVYKNTDDPSDHDYSNPDNNNDRQRVETVVGVVLSKPGESVDLENDRAVFFSPSAGVTVESE
jgi:prepilin-type N-terminal cleavage/methylation domain-containing protein